MMKKINIETAVSVAAALISILSAVLSYRQTEEANRISLLAQQRFLKDNLTVRQFDIIYQLIEDINKDKFFVSATDENSGFNFEFTLFEFTEPSRVNSVFNSLILLFLFEENAPLYIADPVHLSFIKYAYNPLTPKPIAEKLKKIQEDMYFSRVEVSELLGSKRYTKLSTPNKNDTSYTFTPHKLYRHQIIGKYRNGLNGFYDNALSLRGALEIWLRDYGIYNFNMIPTQPNLKDSTQK